MKPIVFALDAQSGVDAVEEGNGLCITAYTILFHFSWRPNFVALCYELGVNLLCGE